MAALYCNRCGHRNPAGSNFCSSCGAPLDVAGTDVSETITFTPIESAGEVGEHEITVGVGDYDLDAGLLVVKRGPNAGSRFALGPEVTTLGRHPDSDVFLDDVTVSRRHAEIVRRGNELRLHDVSSLNGTYLNRERIEDEVTLHHGDELQIGKFRLVFLSEADGQ
ncbi:zinc-ribbon and FHA domain-containing protein [Acidiferrimicrobium sp. IK]|uniref:FHA domain-containing protein n=1 Tax=Acidiferrimicrobium sp. IK TaxID=2871700 RepID=UPI002916E8FF|nr:FHA domain-containing protein [Acidiferrimicrobium sp. IK]MCU4184705.1 zinc-ribbon and FHA domain-containing protein [Acidiferrimicrobium sp. IK]